MKRSMQEIVELLVFALIALLVGTGVVWLVGWILGLAGTVLTWLAALVWSLLRFLVPIAIVAAAVYALVRLMNRSDRDGGARPTHPGGADREVRTTGADGRTPPTRSATASGSASGDPGVVVPGPAHTGAHTDATGTARQETPPGPTAAPTASAPEAPGVPPTEPRREDATMHDDPDRNDPRREGDGGAPRTSVPHDSAPGGQEADPSKPVTPPPDDSASRGSDAPGDVGDSDDRASHAPKRDVDEDGGSDDEERRS